MIEPLAHIEGMAVTLGPRLPRLLTATPLGYRILLVDGWAYVTDGEPLPEPTRPGRAVREILAARPAPPIAHSMTEEPVGPLRGWAGVWKLMVKGEVGFGAMRVDRLVLHRFGVTVPWAGRTHLVPRQSLAHVVLDAVGTHVLIPVDRLNVAIPEVAN